MKKVNVSVKQMGRFAGKWVAIDDSKDKIVAVSENPEEIRPFVSRPLNDKTPTEQVPYAFKVPYKNEGPYIL